MGDFDGRWSKFKQELLPIVYVSVIQLWWLYKFPPTFLQVGAPWDAVILLGQSVTAIICTVFVFSYADKLKPFANLEYINSFPHLQTFKTIQRASLLIAAIIGAFFLWYKDIYHMSNTAYILLYLFWGFTFALLYRAAYRVPST